MNDQPTIILPSTTTLAPKRLMLYVHDQRVMWILTTASYCHILGTEQICNCCI